MNYFVQMTIILYIAIMNITAFITYGVDKQKAIKGKWRIPEHTLILLAYIGGAYGAILGMSLWHHKTQKLKFRTLVPLAVVLNSGVIAYLLLM